MKHKYVLITLFFMLVTSGTLFAHNDPADVPPLAILKNVLNLSEEQVGEIGGLLEARAEAVRPLAEQIKIFEQALKELLNSDLPDPAAVGDLVLDIQMLRQEIAGHRQSFREGFHMLLTAEQIERIGNIHKVALATRAAQALGQLGLY
ncbi:MAG: hypothetical protein WBM36_03260 [Lysobacterales bacterium]|jgi:Spy/CpxP family protein refolding chaperone